MSNIFKQAETCFTKLINLREKQIKLLDLLSKFKDVKTQQYKLQFKIKYYYIWIQLIKNFAIENKIIKNEDDIIELKLTKKLETYLIEILKTGTLIDFQTIQKNINELETELYNFLHKTKSNTKYDNNDNENNENDENDNNKDNNKIIQQPEININKPIKKLVIDTKLIEAKPKILLEEQRPTDYKGSSIYDLRYIYGVGPSTAIKLFEMGITLELLLNEWELWTKKHTDNNILMFSKMPTPPEYTKKIWDTLPETQQNSIQHSILFSKLTKQTKYLCKLNIHQLMGIKYFKDIGEKINRSEIIKAEKLLTTIATHINKDIILTLCGSYRRGKDKSGDIDCLITHPSITTIEELELMPQNILMNFVTLLTNVNFLIDHLTDYGKTKYMGFCIIPNKKITTARRIDIRFIPFNSYGTAILYFTGSKNFNTQMRTIAKNKGYKLNEYGLIKLSTNDTPDKLIPCKTELDVFNALKIPFKEPHQRDI